MARISPLGALARGLVAGAAGSLAQNLFFAATKKITPSSPDDAFTPPEPAQRDETSTQTVARRTVEDLLQRGPLVAKEPAGQVVHYAFGAGWGGAYGLARETLPALASPVGALGFGAAVWMASDNFLLPVFKLAAWPPRYPLKNHAYALAAHFVYGATVAAAYAAQRALPWGALAAVAGSYWSARRLPKLLRPAARRVARVRLKRAASPLRHAARSARL